MIEIRIHGRGGQGGVTLAKIIAASRFLVGKSVQAFGLYAAERAGAPIQAFCRYDDAPIANRNLIYEPDHVIVLDPTLIGPAISSGLKPGGWILLNTPQAPEEFVWRFPGSCIATVDATSIARESKLGTRSVPIVNTALSGALGNMLQFHLEEMHAALAHLGFGGSNLTAASQAYEQVRLNDTESEAVVVEAAPAEHSVTTEPSASFIEGAGGARRKSRPASGPPNSRVDGRWCRPATTSVRRVMTCTVSCWRWPTTRQTGRWRILLETTPFPSICGRICPAPCMASCNRIQLDGAVNVVQLERLAGDRGDVTMVPAERRDARVAVIGSGPAGLSAAYHLARLGYGVTVFESGPELGGLLRTGIPEFRLPEAVVDREIDRILQLGVKTRTNQRVGRQELLQLSGRHDAVLVATGLQELRSLRLGVGNNEAVWQGIDFLDRSRQGQVRVDDEDVLVVGGGNTAMDAARSAVRLGARSVHVVYRRTREQMPAIPEEIDEAYEEGVSMEFLAQPIAVREEAADGGERTRCIVTFRRTELGPPDESGRRRPLELPGSDFDFGCHRLILALGQSTDLSVFPEGTEVREGQDLLGLLETPVFAIGDLATNDGTVAGAIGSGRRSALHIHEVLSGETIEISEHATTRRDVDVRTSEVIRPDAMKLHLFERHFSRDGATIPDSERRSTFHEVHTGLPDAGEAERCLSCGVCNECNLCATYCPEGVLKQVGNEYVFDYSFCKGCGVCVTECPRNVIFMSHL